jgi:hypothetical protein
MTEMWTQAALWMGLALIATLVAIWTRVATALSEIVIGTVAQLIIGAALGSALLAADASWLQFLAGAGAILHYVREVCLLFESPQNRAHGRSRSRPAGGSLLD